MSLGVNTPDHAVIFSNLFAMLQARVTSLVATLRAKDCTSVKYLLGMMLKQLLALPDLVSRMSSNKGNSEGIIKLGLHERY